MGRAIITISVDGNRDEVLRYARAARREAKDLGTVVEAKVEYHPGDTDAETIVVEDDEPRASDRVAEPAPGPIPGSDSV